MKLISSIRVTMLVLLLTGSIFPTALADARSAPDGPGVAARSVGAQVLDDDPCFIERYAHDLVHAQAITSLHALEYLRQIEAALNNAYNRELEGFFWETTVDFATIVAGWPLGSALNKLWYGEVATTIIDNLAKTAFASLNASLLKTALTADVNRLIAEDVREGWKTDQYMQFAQTVMSESLAQSMQNGRVAEWWGERISKEIAEDASGKIFDSIFTLLNLGKFVWTEYEGWTRVNALEDAFFGVSRQIASMEQQHEENFERLKVAQRLVEVCDEDVQVYRLKPRRTDAQNPYWAEISNYLGLPDENVVVVDPSPDSVPTPEPTVVVEPPPSRPPSVPAPQPPPVPVQPASACAGDERITFSPANPKVGDEVGLTVSSSKGLTNISLDGGANLTGVSDGGPPYSWTFKFKPDGSGRRDFTFRASGQVCTAGFVMVNPAPAVPAPAPPPPAPAPVTVQYYVFVLEGIGFYIGTEAEVNTKRSCDYGGGGRCPPSTQPARVLGRYSGPFPSVQAAKADLKTKLQCRTGYWGAQAQWGSGGQGLAAGGWHWLQNNVGTADCRTIQRL